MADDFNPFDILRNPQLAADREPPVPAAVAADNPFDALRNPVRAYVPKLLDQRLRERTTWRDVEPELKRLGADPEQYRQDYQLAEARAVQKGEGYGSTNLPLPRWLTGTAEAFTREYMPFGSLLDTKGAGKYAAAKKKLDGGQSLTQDEINTVARYEQLNGLQQELGSTFQGKAVQALGGGGRVLGEFTAAGGALSAAGRAAGLGQASVVGRMAWGQPATAPLLSAATPTFGQAVAGAAGRAALITPLVPSGYLDAARQRNIEQGRDANDIRGFPTPVALSFANNLVLGQFQQGIKVPATAGLGRAAAGYVTKGAIGVGEQAAVDATGGLLDRVLPDAYQTRTRYGLVGELWRGEVKDAAQSSALTLATFSIFSALHGRDPRPLSEAFAEAMNAQGRKGMPRGAAGEAVSKAVEPVVEVATRSPDPTRAEAREAVKEVPAGPLRKYAEALADTLPERPAVKNAAPDAASNQGSAPGPAEPVFTTPDPVAVLGEQGVRDFAKRSGLPATGRIESVLNRIAKSPSTQARLDYRVAQLTEPGKVASRGQFEPAPPSETPTAPPAAPESRPRPDVPPDTGTAVQSTESPPARAQELQTGTPAGPEDFKGLLGGAGQAITANFYRGVVDSIRATGEVPSAERGANSKLAQAWALVKARGFDKLPDAADRFVAAARQAASRGDGSADWQRALNAAFGGQAAPTGGRETPKPPSRLTPPTPAPRPPARLAPPDPTARLEAMRLSQARREGQQSVAQTAAPVVARTAAGVEPLADVVRGQEVSRARGLLSRAGV